MKYKSHSFSTELAKIVGLKESIILSHLYFWFEKNRSNKRNFYDGTWWTFNSIKAFSEQFEYLSEKEIRGALKRLNELGYTVEGCYNAMKIDKTKWYSLTDKAVELFGGEPICQKVEPFIQKGKRDEQKGETIPDINTDNKHIYKTPNPLKGEEVSDINIEHQFTLTDWIDAYKRVYEDAGKRMAHSDIDKEKIKKYFDKWVNNGRDPQKPLRALQGIFKNDWERNNSYPSARFSKIFNVEVVNRFAN